MSSHEEKREARELLPSPRNFSPRRKRGPAPESPLVLDLAATPVPRAVPQEGTAPEDASERFAFALWSAGRKEEAIQFLERQIDLRRETGFYPRPEPAEGAGESPDLIHGQGDGTRTAAFPQVADPGAEDAQPAAPTPVAPKPIVSESAGPVPLPRPVTPADSIAGIAPRKNQMRVAALAASLVLATGAVLAMNYLAPPGAEPDAAATGEPLPLAEALDSVAEEGAETAAATPAEEAAPSPAATGSLAAETPLPAAEEAVAGTAASRDAVTETAALVPVSDSTPPPAEEPAAAAIEEPAAPAPIEGPASAAAPLPHPKSATPDFAASGPAIPETPVADPTPAPGLAALSQTPPSSGEAPAEEPVSETTAAEAAPDTSSPAQPSPLDSLFAAIGRPASAEAALAAGVESSFALAPRLPAPRPEFRPEMLAEEPAPRRVARAQAPAPAPDYDDSPILADVPPGGRVLYGEDGEPLVVWRVPGHEGRRFWLRPEGGPFFGGPPRVFRRGGGDEEAELAWRRAEAERYIAWRRAQHRRLLHLTFP